MELVSSGCTALVLQRSITHHFFTKGTSPIKGEEDIVYGNRYGNNANGDGWKYRGRGLKQLTFRWNYIACGEDLGLDLEEKPELLLDPINAACSAGWFWKNNNCNYFADRNDISGLTRRINGGFNGLKLRTQHTNRAIAALTP
ncbi:MULTISPECIES: glycoside hydrolase family 19 protein [Erwinia]|uniref:glycoside hydrolase family 19 protein n=1 Tax=Erwinia TaxID=551 RepID=UPI00105D75B8|nr:glycoside hydrolase family 19 protein [Erwinia aphidicola]MCP2234048.1 putative chitinase [Erwinia aphidicola]